MATRREYFNTGDDDGSLYSHLFAYAQSFITTSAYSITSVKLYLDGQGGTGTTTVEIRAVDVDHLPNGSALTTGNTGSISFENTVWKEISLTPYDLDATTEYSIVVYADISNAARWRRDNDGVYDGIAAESGYEDFDSWTGQTYKHLFETWGESEGVVAKKNVIFMGSNF